MRPYDIAERSIPISKMRKLMLREVKYLYRVKQMSEQMTQNSEHLMSRSRNFPPYASSGFLFCFPLYGRFPLLPPSSGWTFYFPGTLLLKFKSGSLRKTSEFQ